MAAKIRIKDESAKDLRKEVDELENSIEDIKEKIEELECEKVAYNVELGEKAKVLDTALSSLEVALYRKNHTIEQD